MPAKHSSNEIDAQPAGESPEPGDFLADQSIVARVLTGDVAAFELLMRRNNARVFRAVRAILRSDADAEDVMQEAYVRAFEHLGSYEGRASFASWLVRIAVNEALQRSRRARQLSPLDDNEEVLSMPATGSTPEQRTSDGELREVLERAIGELPEDFRLVFVLRAVEQMPVAEIAACLELREETVKTRFFRARQRLRQALMNRFDASTSSVFEFHLDRCDRVVFAVLERLRRRRS